SRVERLLISSWKISPPSSAGRSRPSFGRPLREAASRTEGEDMKFRVLIEQDEDGVFVAEVPSLPGCISQGRTRDEALRNVREAIAGYLESLQAHGDAIPPAISEEIVEIEN